MANKIKTNDPFYEYCKGFYYSNTEEGEECLWEPFDRWSLGEIEQMIQDETESLKSFFLRMLKDDFLGKLIEEERRKNEEKTKSE